MNGQPELPHGAIPLATVQPGCCLTVSRVDAGDEDTIRLKRLGICEGREVEVVQVGDPLILRVVGCRVGLSRRLAAKILVRDLSKEDSEAPASATTDDRSGEPPSP